jgi:opacity protein-like surface antigen
MTRSCLVAVLAAGLAVPAAAQTSVDKTVPFELDKWYQLDVKEGPITLHRIRLERQGGGGLKARVRGADEEYSAVIKVELEYSNASSTDWRAAFRISWTDDHGEAIDGYNGSSELDEKKDFDRVGGTVTTLRYGLAHARKLRVVIGVKPD